MIHIERKSECCGCNACGDICPKGAISFVTDEEGFWYPQVDQSKCVDCGLCEKVCPMLHVDELRERNSPQPVCYEGQHKNIEVVFASTSGGMFSALADVAYRKKGYVGGAVHNADFSVSQFISNDRQDLQRLRRSKDLQSNSEGFFQEVRKAVQTGEQVLVCGVPCQMAALRSFLQKDYDNLVIVDLICLGVNSPKVWRKYLEYIEEKYGAKIVDTENKNKEYGWRNLTQKFMLTNGEEIFDTCENSLFIKGFIGSRLYCRPSCYACKFKGFPRLADITIGDYWGKEKHSVEPDDNLGTSVILVNTNKGAAYFEQVKKRIHCKEIPLEWIVQGNPALVKPIATNPNVNRNDFFCELERESFPQVVEKYSKAGVLTGKTRLKQLLRPVWLKLRFAKKVLRVTRCHPKALYQTVRYSGIKNLWQQRGILCGTHCVLEIHPKAQLNFKGLLTLGAKGRFPTSSLETRLLVASKGKLEILGDMIIGYGSDIEVFEGAALIIHGNKHGVSDTNIGCTIICGKQIEIQSDVGMGRNVLIRDNNGNHYMNTSGYRTARPVVIGEKAWLCESCTIMPGVKIGRGAIVGAESMVTSSVPAHALVFGSPAEVVEENVLWKC